MTDEAERLESLWAGRFGDDYTERNRAATDRHPFWRDLLASWPIESALEVGCNVGENLAALDATGVPTLAGVDVNERALTVAAEALPHADLRVATARQLPFPDGSFDLVFTAGVLIHQPDDTLAEVMDEIVRCASRYVLAIEYDAPTDVEVPYRGQSGSLFKRPYDRIYRRVAPHLELVASGVLEQARGWDDATWWLFDNSIGDRPPISRVHNLPRQDS